MATAPIVVLDARRERAFSFDDMLTFHGGGSPGGVAHAFKVLERALPLLAEEPPERHELVIGTAFPGPGARDGFECVTGAVSDGRYTVDPTLTRPELGLARERFVFRLAYHDRSALLVLRAGFVTEEFILLTRQNRDQEQEQRLDMMKADMARRVMSAAAVDVYDAAVVS